MGRHYVFRSVIEFSSVPPAEQIIWLNKDRQIVAWSAVPEWIVWEQFETFGKTVDQDRLTGLQLSSALLIKKLLTDLWWSIDN